jgi:hypothetical protein
VFMVLFMISLVNQLGLLFSIRVNFVVEIKVSIFCLVISVLLRLMFFMVGEKI